MAINPLFNLFFISITMQVSFFKRESKSL